MATSGSPFFNAQNVNYARSIGNIKAILPVVADIEKLGFVFSRQMITNPHQSESSKTESYPMNPYFGSNTTPRTTNTMLHPSGTSKVLLTSAKTQSLVGRDNGVTGPHGLILCSDERESFRSPPGLRYWRLP